MAFLTSMYFNSQQKPTGASYVDGFIDGDVIVGETTVSPPQLVSDVCHAIGAAAARANEPAKHPDITRVLHVIETARQSRDLFPLRWFTFVCMWMCPAVCADVQKNAPLSVTTNFFAQFPQIISSSIFDAMYIRTPLEIVMHLMIKLKLSYDPIN